MAGSRSSPPGGDASDEDKRLWQRATAGIRPLKRRAGDAAGDGGAGPKPPPSEMLPPAALAIRRALPPCPPSPVRPSLPALEVGAAAGVDARTMVRLKRGLVPAEAEIDLHNLTQSEAHQRLGRFLSAAQAAGRRCVLVITGKGYGADGQVGVLKAQVPRWLNEPPNRERVIAFCYAPPARGGEGALLVLLRRERRGAR